MSAEVVTFLGIVLVLTVTPGADMALVMRNVLSHGFRSIVPTALGVFTGLLIHASASIAGLSVVLRNSEVAFSTVKLLGAAWLAWMGIGALLAAWKVGRRPVGELDAAPEVAPGGTFRAMYLRGFLTNILNVKIALFYIAFLPQFAPAGDNFVPIALGLAIVQALIGLSWLTFYAWIVARAGNAIKGSPRTRRWLEGSTGAALVGFGLRLATASR